MDEIEIPVAVESFVERLARIAEESKFSLHPAVEKKIKSACEAAAQEQETSCELGESTFRRPGRGGAKRVIRDINNFIEWVPLNWEGMSAKKEVRVVAAQEQMQDPIQVTVVTLSWG